jgi:hypothetical protein
MAGFSSRLEEELLRNNTIRRAAAGLPAAEGDCSSPPELKPPDAEPAGLLIMAAEAGGARRGGEINPSSPDDAPIGAIVTPVTGPGVPPATGRNKLTGVVSGFVPPAGPSPPLAEAELC